MFTGAKKPGHTYAAISKLYELTIIPFNCKNYSVGYKKEMQGVAGTALVKA